MEKKRQITHIAMVGFAFLLPFLTRPQALACAAGAFFFNAFIMPRLSKSAFREEDLKRGYSTGILIYPVSVFFLILFFPAYIAAGAWAVMAFGDGFATLAGGRPGTRPLPWNSKKSYEGSIAFFIAAAAGSFGLMMFATQFHGPGMEITWLAFLSICSALAAATVESMDMSLDDNISVPFTAGLLTWALHFASVNPTPAYKGNILPGLAASGAVGVLSYALGAVDAWGLIGGIGIGFVVFYFAGWQGFMALLTFFVLGAACTKVGKRVKESRGVAQEKRGRRGIKNALANCAPGMAFAYVFGCASLGESLKIFSAAADADLYWAKVAQAAALAFTGAFAAAAADTVSSELGQVFGKRPVMLTTLRPVPHGVNGGVTLTGSALGAIAATVVSLVAAAAGLVPFNMLWLPAVAGFAGMMIDSLCGALLENRYLVNNEFVNLLCAASGALIAFLAAMIFYGLFSTPLF